jgi:hypothetical protein
MFNRDDRPRSRSCPSFCITQRLDPLCRLSQVMELVRARRDRLLSEVDLAWQPCLHALDEQVAIAQASRASL